MYIIGTHLFGRVDRVAGGLFYVGTVFVHIFWLPLIPLKSFIVRRDKDTLGGFQGVPIGFSIKSALYGWGFGIGALAVLSLLISLVAQLLNFNFNFRFDPLCVVGICNPIITGVVGAALFGLLHITSNASEGRAAELKALTGYPSSQAELDAEKAQIAATAKRSEEEVARLRADPKFQAFQARMQEDYRRSREGAWIGGVLRDFARARGWNVYLVRIGYVVLPPLAAYLLSGEPGAGSALIVILYGILWWRRSK